MSDAVIGNTIAESTPHWPEHPDRAVQRPNVLVVLMDDVGFSDFGCYGSEIETPVIDGLAARGLRYTGFHTTAMCSTTRAALLTGRNHHAVGVGSLANFDSGFPGYRGKLAPDAPTLAERLRPHRYRNYLVGKWHVTRLTETGPSGPFDGWPLGRGFDRFYGFLDAETDHYSPELVRDNSHIAAPGNYESGYHLTEDLIDNALEYLKGHVAATPTEPWFLMVNPGACHAPHQAPIDLIDKYAERFAGGWDDVRAARLARQIAGGLVPEGTGLPPLNPGVKPWVEHSADEQKVFARLQGAYAAMLEHFDTHLGRLIAFVERAMGPTVIAVLSDNGASQEGGPLGFVNAMGPFNGIPEPMTAKLARLADIGGPDTHTNFPHGWAMAANTPLRRYKQNTHGGGVRDPLVIAGIPDLPDPGGVRHQFCHVSDLTPTLLEHLGLEHLGLERTSDMSGVSFASTFKHSDARTGKSVQYFEMFGHRGLWHDGWKAVAFHPPGSAFDADEWELYDLASDFNECHDLASAEPARLEALKALWWEQARENQVLPLDDRFAERFAENAARHRGERVHYEFWAGMGHLPSDVAPDLRSRSYRIDAYTTVPAGGAEGVLIAHGDATSGYSLFVRDGRLVHDLNIGGSHQLVVADQPLAPGAHQLSFEMRRTPAATGDPRKDPRGVGVLYVDGEQVGRMETANIFRLMVSWSGLDVGLDRGTTVADYDGTGKHMGPNVFTGTLERVVVTLMDDQELDHQAEHDAALARD